MSKRNQVNNNHSNKTLITFLIAMMTYIVSIKEFFTLIIT